MQKIVTGQILLIICCVFYLIWWYRGFRPGIMVNRVGGINGILLLITAAFGISGLVCSLTTIPGVKSVRISSFAVITGGIVIYIVSLLVTRFLFHRIVTSELFLINGWTMLEVSVISRFEAAELLSGGGFAVMCFVIAAAFIISMILYVAYYRMEEEKAFCAAMVPLVTEAAAMIVLVVILCVSKQG